MALWFRVSPNAPKKLVIWAERNRGLRPENASLKKLEWDWMNLERFVLWYCLGCGFQLNFVDAVVPCNALHQELRELVIEATDFSCPACMRQQFEASLVLAMQAIARIGGDEDSAWRFFCALYDFDLWGSPREREELGQMVLWV